ncbi:MAG: Gfo/Idh/MocA family oxidoreductase [Caldilineaceae bacterium]
MSQPRTRYAIVGLGGRHYMFHEAILSTFADHAELVALCDVNPGRVALSRRMAQLALTDRAQYQQVLKSMDAAGLASTGDDADLAVPGYRADEFEQMIAETLPDTVIVTTKDATHDDYICRAMELGCDVITEKPMTTDAAVSPHPRHASAHRAQDDRHLQLPLLAAAHPDQGSAHVGRDRRNHLGGLPLAAGHPPWRRLFPPLASQQGKLGGGWCTKPPITSTWSTGGCRTCPRLCRRARYFYRPETGDRYGLTARTERCHTCPEADRCPFALKMAAIPSLKALYLENEQYDGYFRDRCVFSPEMNIEDNMNVVVDYAGGTKMSYSLTAFAPWEGYIISFNGTKGRIEHKMEEAAYINGDGTVPGALKSEGTWIRVYPHWGAAREVEVWQAGGGHGGADPIMLSYIFAPGAQEADPYLRAADQRAGVVHRRGHCGQRAHGFGTGGGCRGVAGRNRLARLSHAQRG